MNVLSRLRATTGQMEECSLGSEMMCILSLFCKVLVHFINNLANFLVKNKSSPVKCLGRSNSRKAGGARFESHIKPKKPTENIALNTTPI